MAPALRAHRLDAEVLAQHLAAAFMHHARSGADVGIRIGGDVFLHEIDEARLALEQAEQLQGGFGGGFAEDDGLGLGGGCDGCVGCGLLVFSFVVLQLCGAFGVEQHGEGEADAAEEGGGGASHEEGPLA